MLDEGAEWRCLIPNCLVHDAVNNGPRICSAPNGKHGPLILLCEAWNRRQYTEQGQRGNRIFHFDSLPSRSTAARTPCASFAAGPVP